MTFFMDVPILSNKSVRAAWSVIADVGFAMSETRCASIGAPGQQESPHTTDAPSLSLGRLEAYCRRAVAHEHELYAIRELLTYVDGNVKGIENNAPGNHYGHRNAGRDYARCHPAFRLDH